MNDELGMKRSGVRIWKGGGTCRFPLHPLSSIFYFLFLSAFILHPSSFIFSAPVQAVVKSVTGKVEFAAPASVKFNTLTAGQNLDIGSTIRTGKDGVAIVLAVPGAAIRVGPDSQLVLNEMDFEKNGQKVASRKALIELKSGTISALIDKNDPETTDFKIKTPQGIAAARGTFYAVTVEGDQAYVAVKEGKVGLQKAGEKNGAGSEQ